MRAVKDGLPTPYGEGEESEGPRWTGALKDRSDHLHGREVRSRNGFSSLLIDPLNKYWILSRLASQVGT